MVQTHGIIQQLKQKCHRHMHFCVYFVDDLDMDWITQPVIFNLEYE